MKRRVAKGQGELDISDPVTLARALNYKAIKKTIIYAVTFSRECVKDPILNESAKDARLQSHSTRHHHYDNEGWPTAVHVDEQSYLPVGGEKKMVTLQGMWPDRSQLLDEIIPVPVLLSLEINISRAEKDSGLQSRREENDARALIMRESKESRNKMWIRKAAEDAKVCGLKPYILCSNAGCIRQFTCQARVDQHTMCGTHMGMHFHRAAIQYHLQNMTINQ